MQFSIRRIRKKRGKRDGKVSDLADELARKGKWLTLVSQQTAQGRWVKLYFSLKPLLIIFVSLALAGYLAGAVVLTWWLDRTPSNRVGFFDVALPWRWSGMNALRGDGFSEQGIKELSAEQVQRGIFYISRGLSLQPNNPAARLALAQVYAKGNYYDGVSRTVLPQLKFGFAPELVLLYLQQAGAADDSEAALDFIAKWRDRADLPIESRQLLSEWEYRTQMHLNNPTAALAAVDHPEYRGNRWTTMRVSALTKLGRLDEAWALAERIHPDLPGVVSFARPTQAAVLRQKGDLVGLKRILDELVDEEGTTSEAWMFAVEQTAAGNFNEQSKDYLASFMRRFGHQKMTVNALLSRIVETENIELGHYAANLMREWQTITPQNRVGLGLLYVRHNRWKLLREEWPANASVDEELVGINRLFQGVLKAFDPDASDEDLRAEISAKRFGLMIYRQLTLGLAEANRWDLVEVVADTGNRYYPHSPLFVEFKQQSEEKQKDTIPDLRLSEAMAQMSRQYEESDLADLKLELLELMEANKWDEVESIVRRVRRQRPVWVGKIEAALDEADAQAGVARSDYFRLIRLAPTMLRRDGTRADWFIDQAELAMAANYTSLGKSLLEAVLAVDATNDRAGGLLKSLTEKPSEEKDQLIETKETPGEP